jgi:hypothetical protein
MIWDSRLPCKIKNVTSGTVCRISYSYHCTSLDVEPLLHLVKNVTNEMCYKKISLTYSSIKFRFISQMKTLTPSFTDHKQLPEINYKYLMTNHPTQVAIVFRFQRPFGRSMLHNTKNALRLFTLYYFMSFRNSSNGSFLPSELGLRQLTRSTSMSSMSHQWRKMKSRDDQLRRE